ncbi:MAG: hypothetical protein EPO54_01575, partial [Brevundimonas sp.]
MAPILHHHLAEIRIVSAAYQTGIHFPAFHLARWAHSIALDRPHAEPPTGQRRIMIESFSFSTQGLTPPEAAETYRNLYDGGADVVSSGQAVSAEVTAHRLDRLILFDRRLTGVGHARPAQRVGLNGFSHFVVHLVVEGV